MTGSSRGIGESVAKEFAKAGYNIVINSRNAKDLVASKEEILRSVKFRLRSLLSRGDISQEEVCRNIFDKAEQEWEE